MDNEPTACDIERTAEYFRRMEFSGMSVRDGIDQWLDYIGFKESDINPRHFKEEDKPYNHDVVCFNEICEQGYDNAMNVCAKSIADRMKDKEVLIIQSDHYPGNVDIPFAMCIINENNHITVYTIEADWEHFRVTEDGKHWKPCYGNELLILKISEDGERVAKATKCILSETPGEDISALKFFEYIVTEHKSDVIKRECSMDTLEDTIKDFLQIAYSPYTPESVVELNPHLDIEEIRQWDRDWDDPYNDMVEFSYYVIYEK
jgi:hypothetical protein